MVLFTELSVLLINSHKIDFPPPLYEFLTQTLKFLWCLLGTISNFKPLFSCLIHQHLRCGAASEVCSLMTWYSGELLIPSRLFSMLRDKSENKGKPAEGVKSV